ncbi:acyltransferase [Streptomyces griseus]|uniref:acyltransferase n=1 Tax=Streptomyces griseus TaxID=1911 RepID=UPI00381924A2
MPSTEATSRLTVAALMHLTGERQADRAAGLGLNQTQISRKQAGTASWSLTDVDKLSACYGIPVGLTSWPASTAPPTAVHLPRARPSSPSPREGPSTHGL